MLHHFLVTSIVSNKKTAIIQTNFLVWIRCHFCFKIFSFFLVLRSSPLCLIIDFFGFILFSVWSVSGIYSFISFAKFGKFSAFISSGTFSAHAPLLGFQGHEC